MKIFKKTLGYFIKIVTIILIIFSSIGIFAYFIEKGRLNPSFFMFIAFCLMLFYVGRRLTVPLADELGDKRPRILYLRSFYSDESALSYPFRLASRLSTRMTDEESLIKLLNKIGFVVAIGKPGEWLPTIGAKRIYCTDENWQDTIVSYMGQSCLVIIRAGETEGLSWELKTARNLVKPEHLVIWHPPKKSKRKTKAIYAKFRDISLGIFTKPLPVDISKSEIIFFDNEWNPKVEKRKFIGIWGAIRAFVSNSRLPRIRLELIPALRNAGLRVPGIPWRPSEPIIMITLLILIFAISVHIFKEEISHDQEFRTVMVLMQEANLKGEKFVSEPDGRVALVEHDHNGKPYFNPLYGYAIKKIDPRTHGDTVDSYHGSSGELINGPEGYAEKRRHWGENNNLLSEAYFGPDGAPVISLSGYYRAERASIDSDAVNYYDTQNNEIDLNAVVPIILIYEIIDAEQPAAKSGLQAGDILWRYGNWFFPEQLKVERSNGTKPDALFGAVRQKFYAERDQLSNDVTQVAVIRHGKLMTIKVPPLPEKKLGMKLGQGAISVAKFNTVEHLGEENSVPVDQKRQSKHTPSSGKRSH